MNNEVNAMNQAVANATPEEIAAKIREIIRILGELLAKFGGKLSFWTILLNASAIIEAIKAIIEVIKAKSA